MEGTIVEHDIHVIHEIPDLFYGGNCKEEGRPWFQGCSLVYVIKELCFWVSLIIQHGCTSDVTLIQLELFPFNLPFYISKDRLNLFVLPFASFVYLFQPVTKINFLCLHAASLYEERITINTLKILMVQQEELVC